MKLDAQIKRDVLDELRWEAEVDDTKIGVIVGNGAVTLTGHVPTYRQKVAATAAAKRVNGVNAIVDNIEVRLPQSYRMTDEGLAERISNVLKWNVSTPSKPIKAEVAGGIVTLTGEVDWHYQRSNVIKNVQHVSGVVGVIDRIALKPRLSTADVQARIKSALERHADIEASNVSVTVVNGTVTLTGQVDSLEEMDRVEAAVWAAPGVSMVVDNLYVST